MDYVGVVKRRAHVGDVVRSISSGKLYLVNEVHLDIADRCVELYDVEALTDRLPNAFGPNEVQTVSAKYLRDLLKAGATAPR